MTPLPSESRSVVSARWPLQGPCAHFAEHRLDAPARRRRFRVGGDLARLRSCAAEFNVERLRPYLRRPDHCGLGGPRGPRWPRRGPAAAIAGSVPMSGQA